MPNGQFPEVIQLANVNRPIGYVIQNNGGSTYIGLSVNGGTDINGDGYSDILIGGTPVYSPGYGGYVVFGGPTVGSDGIVKLTDLNGSNGFRLWGKPEFILSM